MKPTLITILGMLFALGYVHGQFVPPNKDIWDDKSSFERIVVLMGPAMARSTWEKLEIDSDGSVFFYGIAGADFTENKAPTFYTGQLSHKEIDTLRNIMSRSALDKWEDDKQHCADGGDERYHIYYQGKILRRQIRCSLPPKLMEMTSYLYHCKDRAKLKLSDGPHDFE